MMLALPLMMGAKGEGCGGGDDGQITPDLSGEWDVAYADDLGIKITIGGAVYEETLGATGGAVTIDHEGNPITFNFDCSKPEIVCPSEVFPATVSFDQRDAALPRNVYMSVPTSECDGELVDADPAECGAGTNNEQCAQVCDGTVTQASKEAFGRISLDDTKLTVLLGGGVATNGVNCALLGLSVAEAGIETTGTKEDGDWTGVALQDGKIITGYAGGCLWAGDANDDGTVEALTIGAAVELTTSFTATAK